MINTVSLFPSQPGVSFAAQKCSVYNEMYTLVMPQDHR
jgi:hypothetical protein